MTPPTGGPAHQAGLCQGDAVLQLNGRPVETWKCVDVAQAIRCPAPPSGSAPQPVLYFVSTLLLTLPLTYNESMSLTSCPTSVLQELSLSDRSGRVEKIT